STRSRPARCSALTAGSRRRSFAPCRPRHSCGPECIRSGGSSHWPGLWRSTRITSTTTSISSARSGPAWANQWPERVEPGGRGRPARDSPFPALALEGPKRLVRRIGPAVFPLGLLAILVEFDDSPVVHIPDQRISVAQADGRRRYLEVRAPPGLPGLEVVLGDAVHQGYQHLPAQQRVNRGVVIDPAPPDPMRLGDCPLPVHFEP